MNDWVRRASRRGPEGGGGSEGWRVVGERGSGGDTIDVILQVLRLSTLRRSSAFLLVLHQEVERCGAMLWLVECTSLLNCQLDVQFINGVGIIMRVFLFSLIDCVLYN